MHQIIKGTPTEETCKDLTRIALTKGEGNDYLQSSRVLVQYHARFLY
jgi:hypothetical protein